MTEDLTHALGHALTLGDLEFLGSLLGRNIPEGAGAAQRQARPIAHRLGPPAEPDAVAAFLADAVFGNKALSSC